MGQCAADHDASRNSGICSALSAVAGPVDPFAACQSKYLHLVEFRDGGKVEAVEALMAGASRLYALPSGGLSAD
jgi:hypothetical protein